MGNCIYSVGGLLTPYRKKYNFSVRLTRQEKKFPVSAHLKLWRGNTNRKNDFSVGFCFFLWEITHINFIFNLGECNFSVRVRPTEKLFAVRKKKYFSIILFLCVIFWWYTVRKIFFCWYSYFSVDFCTHKSIRVFRSVRRRAAEWKVSAGAEAQPVPGGGGSSWVSFNKLVNQVFSPCKDGHWQN